MGANREIAESVDDNRQCLIETGAETERHTQTVRGEEAQETSRSRPEDLRRIQATIATARENLLGLRRLAMDARTLAVTWNWI